jgi:RNA polymerase sigma factor (sigma-70 family)
MKNGAIFRSFRGTLLREESDEQLLRAFVEGRDENAFTAIVQRHGPLVNRVCRSALQHQQDAEDAFQGTFLVLARKAASIIKGQSLLSWLHGAAYRLTTEMKRSAVRRRINETQVKAMPRGISSEPSEELSWREVEAMLHEEVERLPAKCRAVFLLCGMGGVSHSDAARELGILEKTLSSRLAYARKLLQNRLLRRGVSLAAVLGIIDVSQHARATIQLPLLRSTVNLAMSQSAKGTATACVVAAGLLTIIEGVERSMSSSKLKTTLASLLTVGLIAAGLGGLADHSSALLAGSVQTKASPSGTQQPASNTASNVEAKSITVQGTVLGPDGKPVSGAKLYLGHYSPKDEIRVTESTKSDADGRFKFSFVKSLLSKTRPDAVVADHLTRGFYNFESQLRDEADPHFTPVGQVMAVADGLGCDWARIDPGSETTELALRLVKDVPINGRILDKEGKPVIGAKLYLNSLQAYSDFKQAVAEFSKSNSFPWGERRWGGPLPGQARTVTTGKDGAFSMTGLGGDRYVYLHIEGTGIETTDFQVLTRAGDNLLGPDKITLPEGARSAPPVPPGGGKAEPITEISVDPKRIYGASFRYLAAPSRVIRGVISDKETGKPLANALVGVGRTHSGAWPGLGMLTARTDQEGRFEIQGLAKSPSYDIVALPAELSRYFTILESGIPDTPGVGPMTINLKLPSGIPIRGKVLDERTGKPVPGARVTYYPFFNVAEMGRLRADFDHFHAAESSVIAGPDGSFAMVALPGEGFLGTLAPDFKCGGIALPSRAYKRQEVSDKELNDFIDKYKLPRPEENGYLPRRMKQKDRKGDDGDFLLVTNGRSEGLVGAHLFNNLTFVHPDEKDKELKIDLMLRPAGDEKTPDTKKEKP